ncbi:MAG: thioredoxin family protein [Alphaproteobacteria bacterium]
MVAQETSVCNFGWKAADFDLEGVDGRRYTLADVRGPDGTLVMFICNHCPYVKTVIDRIVRDARALKEKGVGSIAIMPNDADAYPADSFDNMKRWAREKDFPFPYAIDPTQEVARAYDAVCTPDFFGFNRALELQYRGRLDASKTELVPDAPRELFEAMSRVAETGAGPKEQIPSIGCSIKWRQ